MVYAWWIIERYGILYPAGNFRRENSPSVVRAADTAGKFEFCENRSLWRKESVVKAMEVV